MRTVSLIESMQGVRIDVFGEHIGNQWLQRLKNKQDVFLHWSLPYTEHFEVLRRSKLLLRHQIPGSEGADEWVFPALCCGCLPLSNDAPFLMQHLGKALPYYSSFQEIHSLAHHFLKRPQERMETTESLKQKILPAHSWSARGKELLAYLKTKSP